jgi:serpin B
MKKAAETRKRINDWVSEMTHNKILDIIPPSIPHLNTRLVLVNAVYFKATWATPFDKARTTNAPFHLESGKTVSVPMMRRTADYGYAEDKLMQVLELPYSSNRFSMMIFLPKESTNFALVERSLYPVRIEQWRQKCKQQEVGVYIPRFKSGSQFDLKPSLRERGMKLAFTQAADFSGITPIQPFWIFNILHKACIDVDEAGTEAAAATAVDMSTGFPKWFAADHPFLFLIRANRTGTILFLGRVVDPGTPSN